MKIEDIMTKMRLEGDFFWAEESRGGMLHWCSEQYCAAPATHLAPIKLGMHEVKVPLCREHVNQIDHAVNILPELKEEHPEAKCVLVASAPIYRWLILRCPFCAQQHRHGGGSFPEDDPRKELGYRVPHCADPFREVSDPLRQYKLVELEPGAEPIFEIDNGRCSNCQKLVFVPEGYQTFPPE